MAELFFAPLAIPQRPFAVKISGSPEATVGRLRPVLLLLGIPFLCLAQTDSRIPAEVRYKSGYINPVPKLPDFTSAMLWGIVIADNRLPGYQHAQVEIDRTQLSCRVDGKGVVLNDDRANVRGGLYRRYPWFGTDAHDHIPLAYSKNHRAIILRVGKSPDRVWHFWSASPRVGFPPGHLEGCTVKARVRISRAALLQMGMDYWSNPTIGYGAGAGAGASDWYFPSNDWQDAVFTDIRHH